MIRRPDDSMDGPAVADLSHNPIYETGADK
jgi:hypothetical protein